MSPVAQLAIALEHEPAGTEQCITEHEPEPSQDRKWMQPAERPASVLTIHDRNAAHHRTDGGALDERNHCRAKKESPIPDAAHAVAAEAKLERNATEDQSRQQQEHREIERTEKDCVDVRERCKQRGASHDQPGLVAVPKRSDRVHHPDAVRFVPGRAEQHPNAEIKTIQDNVKQDRARDNGCPKHCQMARLHRAYPLAWRLPPVAESAVSANAIGRLAVAPGIGFSSVIGPSRRSLKT